MSLELTSSAAAAIRRHAEDGYPHEVCGVLVGGAIGERMRRAVAAWPLENERNGERERRFAVSGPAMLRAERRATAEAVVIVGYYHSHPDAAARPSGYDLDHAVWPGISYPILSVLNGAAADLTSWTLAEDRGRFEQEELAETQEPEELYGGTS